MSLLLLLNPKGTNTASIGLSDGPERGAGVRPSLHPIEPLRLPDYVRTIKDISEPIKPEPKPKPTKVKFTRIPTQGEIDAAYELNRVFAQQFLESQPLLQERSPTPTFETFAPMNLQAGPTLSEQFLPEPPPAKRTVVETVTMIKKLRAATSTQQKVAALARS